MDANIHTIEREYKYKADDVSVEAFRALMNNVGWERNIDVSSWDYYYTKKNDVDSFIRFRDGARPQLTKKQKTVDTNNWHRIEVDVPLLRTETLEPLVREFVKLEGYKENFRIYKTCFIYHCSDVNYVYYVVFDENMLEKGRYIEVEVNKDKALYTAIDKHATPLESLGLSSRNRMKRSIFEIYRKD